MPHGGLGIPCLLTYWFIGAAKERTPAVAVTAVLAALMDAAVSVLVLSMGPKAQQLALMRTTTCYSRLQSHTKGMLAALNKKHACLHQPALQKRASTGLSCNLLVLQPTVMRSNTVTDVHSSLMSPCAVAESTAGRPIQLQLASHPCHQSNLLLPVLPASVAAPSDQPPNSCAAAECCCCSSMRGAGSVLAAHPASTQPGSHCA